MPDHLNTQEPETYKYMMDYLVITKRAKSLKQAGKMSELDFYTALLFDNLKQMREEYIIKTYHSKEN